MIKPNRSSLAPIIWEHNYSTVKQILQCVEVGSYCAILGPRFSGKTAILRHVKQSLDEISLPCIYIDLFRVQAPTQGDFFTSLVTAITEGISTYTDHPLMAYPEEASSAVFRGFLSRCVEHLGNNLTVIFDHLEELPTDLNRALLTSLRALYMEQQDRDLHFIAIVSGALSLAALTVGETSPFHGIAHRMILGELSEDESRKLVIAHTSASDVQVSVAARSLLLEATRGNSHLIKAICERSIAAAAENRSRQVSVQTVNRIIGEFLREEASGYEPLREAVRLIEDDPDLLQSILRLIKSEIVPRRELPLLPLPDLDPLYLTGMVDKVGQDNYRIRNRIYRRHLEEHFNAARTGYLLTVSGRWDAAIAHLESSIVAGNLESRADLLAATINSMYASETEEKAAYYLIRGLSAAFQVEQITVWLLAPDGQKLALLDQKGATIEGVLPTSVQEIPIDADRIEARSYRQECILRDHQNEICNRYVIPLMVPGRPPVGVVTLCESLKKDTSTVQRAWEFQLQSFLNQAARALFEVEYRRTREARATEQDERLEKQTHQLILLHRVSTLSQTIGDLEKISHLILTAITAHFGLGFDRAWLFLLDRKKNSMTGQMGIGSLTEDQAYREWEKSAPVSFEEYITRLLKGEVEYDEIDQPTRKLSIPISESSHDLFSMTMYQRHTFQWSGAPEHGHALPPIFRQRFEPGEMILTPLVVHNNCLGLIAVDNKFRPRSFTETDELLLKTFANQMATAIFSYQQHEQEKQRLRLEETLRDTSLIIGGSLELKEVLRLILKEMKKVLPFDTASIQLAYEESHSLQIIANAGFDDPQHVETLNFPLQDDYPNVRVYKRMEPLHFDDVQEHFSHFSDPHYRATHIHGWLGAPLISNDRAIGVITLDSKTPGIYTAEHDRLAVLFAGQASVAIENASLYQNEKETREYLDLLVGSSQDGIIAVDNEGWVIRYSEGSEKILGYPPEEVLHRKKRVDELYGSLDAARKINSELIKSGKVRDYETTVVDRDNNPVPIILSASLLRDKSGEPFGSVGFFKDLRPLRKVENNLRMILDTVDAMSKVNSSEAGLTALAERIVASRLVTFCNILLLDDSKQNLVLKVAYPVSRDKKFTWQPAVGENIPVGMAGLMSHLMDLPESRVYQKGQMIEDVDVVRYFQEFVSSDDELHSVLIVPLKAGSEVFGICVLGEARSWERSPFNKEKIELVSSMVTQGTVFVDRLQAHEATKNKLVMVERLRSIGEDLVTASPDASKSILDKVVRAACEVTGASSAIIYPWDAERRTYDTDRIVHFGLRKKKSFSPKVRHAEGSMTGIVVKKGMVIVDDIQEGLDRSGETRVWAREGSFLELEGVRAFIGISLRTRKDALGGLFVNFQEPHYFSDSELEAVGLFANQAAIAIENARLYEDLNLRLEESTRLQEVGTSLTDTRDLNTVLDRVLQAAFELIHADEANILFYDESKDEFSPNALMSAGIRQPLQPYQTQTRQRDGYTYEIITSKKLISIPDTTLDPRINPTTLKKGRRAAVGVPLIGRESPVGVLWMHWSAVHQISKRDERLLNALAGQAAVAIENANLFNQLKVENARKNEESRALQEVGISLTGTIDLHGVLHPVFQAALRLVEAEEGSILLYDESRDEFLPDALMCKGVDRPIETYETKVRQRSGLAYEIIAGGKWIAIPDTEKDPRISKVAIQKGRRATVGVPLVDYEGPVGVLWVNWKVPRQVSSSEASLLTTLASLATVAIKGARRYEGLQRRSAHLEAVHQAGKVISAASVGLDQQQVLDRILEQAVECVTGISGSKASVGTIQFLDDDTNELVVKSVFPQQYPQRSIKVFDHINLDPKKRPDGRIGVTGRAALTRQAQLVSDVSKDDDYIAHDDESKSELAVPMLDNGRVIGVLDVEGKEMNAFDEMDRDSLTLLVDLAVVALRNAEQAEQLTRSNAVGLMGAWGAEIVHDINREVGYIRRELFWVRQQLETRVDLIESLAAIDERAGHLALPEIPERLPGQEPEISTASADLDSAIRSAVEIYRREYPAISFQFEPGCADSRVAMHERFVIAIFRNLLRNAEHALSQDDSDGKWVNISTRVDGSMALIEVKNSGPQVRESILPYLFKRLIPHEDGRKGRGLLLVGFLVEQHGGRSEVVSDADSGAFFRFLLPLAVEAEDVVKEG